MVQQEEGRERLRDKLPALVQQPDWWFPPRLACEQCSSERTAAYKAELIRQHYTPSPSLCREGRGGSFIDLTGGYGIDSFYLSAFADEAHYVEQDSELCRIATHNFAHTRPHLQVHNTTAEEFLRTLPDVNNETNANNVLVFLDPARRDTHGGKVFRLEDCTPNVIDLLPLLQQKSTVLMMKLSPMLDITAALRSLGEGWQVHVVAVRNEVKELLFIRNSQPSTLNSQSSFITAANYMHDHWQTLSFTLRQEQEAEVHYWHSADIPRYLYEPNAAILKSAAFRFVSEHFRLSKLAPNTHLYAAEHLLKDFPGRVWEVVAPLTSSMLKHLPDTLREQGASIVARNYPMTAEQLRKKLKLKDGVDYTLVATRLLPAEKEKAEPHEAANKPCIFWAKRI